MSFLQFRSRVQGITERRLNTKDVGSAERLARATIRQPLTNGTRNCNQTTRRWNTRWEVSCSCVSRRRTRVWKFSERSV